MEQKSVNIESQKALRDLLTKKPWSRVMPTGHCDHGITFDGMLEMPVIPDRVWRKYVTQEDFLRELDPSGHLINDKEYYPDIWRQDSTTGLWYIEEVPRYAFAFQRGILIRHLSHLCGNKVQFELADEKDDEKSRKVYNVFRRGWDEKNMDTAWFKAAKAVKSTGDGAFVGYIKDGKFGWKVLSFAEGDRIFPHYDPITGKLNLLARSYCSYDEDGSINKKFVEVWDDTYYYRYKADGDPKSFTDKAKKVWNAVFQLSGYTPDCEPQAHNFGRIPVAYHRDDMGACWTMAQEAIENYEFAFSRMAQSNHDFGLPIMYVKGEGSEEVTKADMSKASKVIMLPTDGEVGFVNKQDASTAYDKELETLERQIYQQSFTVRPPELKSGDLPGVAIKLLYSPAYEQAMNDAKEFDTFVDDMVEIFTFGYGVEAEMRLDFLNTPISHYIKPYVHLNETELTVNLATSVQNGFLSKQTASEKCPYATPQEWDRIQREKKEEEKNDLLVQQQTLEMQTEIELDKQEELNEINAETTPGDGSGGGGTKSKSTGSKENGTYNNPNYDRWGNRRNLDGKVNKWGKWDKTHV